MIEALDNIQATIDAPIIITASISNPTYKGQPGEKGDTPVKGVDYFTVEEVSEFKQDIENNLNLSAVATSGSYNDLSDKPSIPDTYELPVATATTLGGVKVGKGLEVVDGTLNAKDGTAEKIEWDKVSGKPEFATVATSGSYNDLVDKPIIPSTAGLASTTYVDNKVAGIVVPTVPTKVSAFENDANYATEQFVNTMVEAQNTAMVSSVRQVNERITNLSIPTKVSELENDSGYLTEHQSLENYITEEHFANGLAAQNTATNALIRQVNERIDGITVPTKVSELENDAGYLTTHQSLAEYAKTADLAQVAKTGSYNDLADKPTIPSTTGLASTEYVDSKVGEIVIPTVPTNVSAFENDAGYLTEHQSLADYSTTTEVQAMIDASVGEGGKDEVYVGTTAPTDTNIKLWVDTSASGSSTPSSVSWNDITDKPTNFDDWGFTATEETLDGTITLNKTFDEIKAAYHSGKNIICVFSSPRLASFGYSVSIMPLTFYGDTIICFSLGIAMNKIISTNASLMITGDGASFIQTLIDPSQFITDSSLTEKGYQTEAQVQAMISSAINAITNGNEVSY